MEQRYFYDLHCHSDRSHDSDSSLEEIIHYAKKRGLTGIAITDHNVFYTGPEELDGIKIIPGVEITLDDGAHLLGLFVRSGIPLIKPRLKEAVSEIHEQKGIAILAHICRRGEGWFYLHSVGKDLFQDVREIVDGFETCNAKDHAQQYRATQDVILKNPWMQTCQTAGSDAHVPGAVGYAVLETSKILTAENMRQEMQKSIPRLNKKLTAVKNSSERLRKIAVTLSKATGFYYIPGLRHLFYRLWQQLVDFKKTHQKFNVKD